MAGGGSHRGGRVASPLDRSRETAADADAVGILLLGPSGKIVGVNEEALRLAAEPARGLESLRDECAANIAEHRPRSASLGWSKGFQVGDRVYHCQAFPLARPPRASSHALTLILIKQVLTPECALSRLCAEFRLTRRERETIDFLAHGLTNKEIAGRMGLSCNTVKAFVRSVMTKLSISTRTGIVGALVSRMG